jgi:drug/metabolite transporter (DMT)-like permease
VQFWIMLLAANAWSVLVLVQGLRQQDKERMRWLQRRALVCAWMAFLGALIVAGAAIFQIRTGRHVSESMHAILYALLMMLLPLATRTIVNARTKRLGS